jgi:hypothetical protein
MALDMTDMALARVAWPELDDELDQSAHDTPVRRRVIPDLLVYAGYYVVYAGYVLCGTGVLGHLWWHTDRRVLKANPGDHTFFEWNLAHGLRVVTGQESPLFSHAINAPDGVNTRGVWLWDVRGRVPPGS